ncbi:MAG: hypothetical protein ACI3WT_04405 [Phascolarctobacterium sp.]
MYSNFSDELRDFIEDYDIPCVELKEGVPLEQMAEAYPDSEIITYGTDEAMGTIHIAVFTGLFIKDELAAYKELDRINLDVILCKVCTAEVSRHGIRRREIIILADVFDYVDSFPDVMDVSELIEQTYEEIRPWLLNISVNGHDLCFDMKQENLEDE